MGFLPRTFRTCGQSTCIHLVGLKNERRRKYFKILRREADSAIEFVKWTSAPLTYPSDRHLTYEGDPRDVDKVTHLMLHAIEKLMELWTPDLWKNKAFVDRIRDDYGPLAMEILEDRYGYRSFWKHWSVHVAKEFKEFYRFLGQNGFPWPPGGSFLEYIGHEKDEVPYVRLQ